MKSNSKQSIFVDGEYEFDYEVLDNNKHTLYYSNSDIWNLHIKNTVAFQIEDDGNGLKLLTKFNEKSRIDYSESEYLFILLKLINQPRIYEISTKKLL